jgi:hypothetical protein
MLAFVPGISTTMARSHGSLASVAAPHQRLCVAIPASVRRVLTGPAPTAEVEAFERRAIALRALRSAADGTQLIDGLAGEVVAETT